MRFTKYLAALAACSVAMLAAAVPASADPPVIPDVMTWMVEDPTETDTDALSYQEIGAGDYVRYDECDFALPLSCDVLTGAAPIIGVPKTGSYPAGSKAEWTYTVPGGPDTYIRDGGVMGVNVPGDDLENMENSEPFAYGGVWNGSTWSSYDSTTELEAVEVGLDGEGAPGDRQIKFGVESSGAVSNVQDHWAGVGYMIALLGDDVPPTQTIDPDDIPDGWIDETPITIPIAGEDNGLGVKRVLAVGPKRSPATWFDFYFVNQLLGCAGNSADPCPAETPPGYDITIEPAKIEEGPAQIMLAVIDTMDNAGNDNSGETFYFSVDTKDPVVSLGGTFTATPGMVLDGPLYTLDSDAIDGTGTGINSNSGVVDIEILIDDVQIDTDSQSCPTDNCDLGLETEIDPDNFTNGDHVLKVKATDAVGHVKTETVEFEVDR